MVRKPKKMHRGGRQRKTKRPRVTRQTKIARASSQATTTGLLGSDPDPVQTPRISRPPKDNSHRLPRSRPPKPAKDSPLDLATTNLSHLPGDLRRIGIVSLMLMTALIVLTIILR